MEAIVNREDEFSKIVNAKDFRNKFGEIKGERNKRIPKEFRELTETQPLLFNKQWYHFAELSPKIILHDDLMETVLEYASSASKMRIFLKNALYN